MDVLDKLTNELKAKCNRYLLGYCQNIECMKRGGFKRGKTPLNYSMATCLRHEQVKALDELRNVHQD